MRTHLIRASLSVVASLLIVSCCCPSSSKTPPHTGAFLKQSTKLVEMREYKGGPPKGATDGIPVTSDRRPEIVLWYPEVNLSLLVLYGEGTRSLPYDATPGRNGIITIRPRQALSDDLYHLSQGSPMLPSALISHWCFRVKGK